jgi:hypothetical protein
MSNYSTSNYQNKTKIKTNDKEEKKSKFSKKKQHGSKNKL